MKYILLIAFSVFLSTSLSAQGKYIYVIKGDSVKFTKYDSCELIIENHSQTVPGFLYNRGRGRTEFRRAFIQISDSAYLVGTDTLTQSGWSYWVNRGNSMYDVNAGPVGIHRQTPVAMLDLPGAVNVDDTSSYWFTGTPVVRLNGLQSGSYTNFYFGPATGTGNPGNVCTYVGPLAGGYQTAGNNNTMAGSYAGVENFGIPANNNTFLGSFAVQSNSGSNLTAVGIEAADGNGGYATIAVGNAASQYSIGKTNCVYIGDLTGTATNQPNTNLTTYIGGMAGAVETGAKSNNTLIGASTSVINKPHVPPTLVSNSTAIGYRASVGTSNTMVFGDDSVNNWAFNSFTFNIDPGFVAFSVGYDYTNGNGAYLLSSGAWTNASDRNKKENFLPIDETDLLDRIDHLPITRWNYKGQPDKHIGPVAQAFYRAFALGDDDKTITTLDPSGITLAGIQGIYRRLQNARLASAGQQEKLAELQQKIASQQAELQALLAKFNDQETELDQQEDTLNRLIGKPAGNDQP
jgi:hypothetical protein